MNDPIAFAGAVIALLVTPGPTNTLLGTSGATMGVRRSLSLVPAELGGYLTSIAALTLAVGPHVNAHPALGRGLRIVSALCLLYIASRLWRARQANTSAITVRHVFVTTLLNPKALVFAFAILPPLNALRVAAFATLVVTIGVLWISVGAAFGARTPRAVETGTVRRIGALVLVAFAIALLASTCSSAHASFDKAMATARSKRASGTFASASSREPVIQAKRAPTFRRAPYTPSACLATQNAV